MNNGPVSPAAIVAEARSWLGTPYRHQASLKHVGADCLGLVRGLWRAIEGKEPEAVPAYSPDWSETTGDDQLLAAGFRNFVAIRSEDLRIGDVLVLRLRRGRPAKHCAIYAGENRIIHAYEGAAVVENTLTDIWRRSIAGIFRFPASVGSPVHLEGR